MPNRPPSPSSAASSPWQRSRRQALLGGVALAALLHLAVLGTLGEGLGEPPARAAAWVSVRTIAAEAPVPPVEAVATPAEDGAGSIGEPRAAPIAPVREVVKASTRSPDPEVVAEAREVPGPEEANVRSASLDVSLDPTPDREPPPPAVAEADALVEVEPLPGMLKVALESPRAVPASLLAAGERPPPTYRTVLAPPATLRYELRRGLLRGTGEIRWRPAADRYALQFEARLAGLTLLAQSSQGELGVHGLAPVRFLDQRARKAARSVNFSRDSATISFSSSTTRWPLLPGSQDRLSWMIQLGGIVAADPALAASGRISMVLVSARGEASVRAARFAGRETAETANGGVPSLKFVVDGHSVHDGSFEIWLDPARGYLPVRAVSRASTGEAEFELLLQRADP